MKWGSQAIFKVKAMQVVPALAQREIESRSGSGTAR